MHHKESPVYTAAFISAALTTNPYDIVGILASSQTRVVIHKLEVGIQDATPISEDLGVSFLRGSTASSTSASITPTNIEGWSGVPTAASSVTGPSSGLVSTASASLIYALGWHHQDDLLIYEPRERQDRFILAPSQRLHVRITAPSSAIALYGTLTFSEIGKNPV